jgi:uncharacterized protein (TIGR00369 family)
MNTTSEETLQAWLAREAEVRATQLPPGVASIDEIRQRTGLELLQGLMSGDMPSVAMGHSLDFLLVEASAGRAVFQGMPSDKFLNPMGTLHGGWFSSLLDSALACAVQSLVPAGRGYTTAELHVNLIKAVTPKIARVRAIGEIIHCGRQLASAQARLVGPDGTLYAHATTTCLIFDLPEKSHR